MLLDGRVCVVSGVGPGLGRRIALALAEHGASVALAARTESKLREVAAEIEAAGGTALVCPTDITDAEQCTRLADAVVERFGGVDAVVNNAFTIDVFKTFADVDLQEWRRLMDVNLFAPLQVCQAFVPALTGRGGGSVVFVNSMVVRKPARKEGGYAVSKGALFTAARVLASEPGPRSIRVNSVLPGWMDGPNVQMYLTYQAGKRGVSEDEVRAGIAANIPLGALPTDAEVAGAVVFLASDLSRSVTGQTIDVNGGEVFA